MRERAASQLTRRDVLLASGGAVGLATLPAVSTARRATLADETGEEYPESAGDQLFGADFQRESPGDVPAAFVLAGNTDQQVTDETAASGTHSYRMDGTHGGCWRALARVAFDVADEMRISGYFRRDDGEEGCHTGSGRIHLQTETGTEWDDGSTTQLLHFHPDGTVEAHGTTIGEYTPYEWTHFEVDYLRQPETGQVTHRYRLDGSDVETMTREQDDHEEDLSALELRSDDFTVFWDSLSVHRLEEEPEEPGDEETDDTRSEPDREESNGGLPWLWFLAGGGTVGVAYYARRRIVGGG